MNANMNTGMMNLQSAVSSPTIISQLLVSLAVVVIVYLILGMMEAIYTYINRMAMYRTTLLPYSYATEDKTYTVIQNPNDANAQPIYLSNNERTGPEFTYSFFMTVHQNTFRQEEGLLHIFHKGNPSQWPLLGPGVYMCANTNTMRIYMNTYKTWNTYVDVENIPVGKWVHVALICKAGHLEVFVNGNLAKRLGFDGFAPYQNYGNIICFSQRRIEIPKTVPSLEGGTFSVFGSMKGLFSSLTYFSYALSYTEVNAIMNKGPSKTFASSVNGMTPPYLTDSWWTNNA